MAVRLWNGYPLIDDTSTEGEIFEAMAPPGARFTRGGVPRDYRVQSAGFFAPPSGMPEIPESDWAAWADEEDARQSSLEHLYLGPDMQSPAFENLDQNGDGYCWGYSTGHAIMIARLRDHQPAIRINPHAACAIIKRGRDEGGWCGLSAEFAAEEGYAVEGNGPGQWPLHSRDLRFDTPGLRASMKLHRVTEDWMDLAASPYDRNLTRVQVASALFLKNPCAVDFNWWSHSVCAIRKVRVERGSFGTLILNSWLHWGRFGLAVLQGSKEIPDGAVCTRSAAASRT